MKVKGVLLSLFANFCFQMMNVLIKVASIYTNITSLHLLYLRSAINVILISTTSQIHGYSILEVHKDDSPSLLLRVMCGVVTNTINFVSIFLINISVFTSLRMISPAITSLLAYFILGELLTFYDFIAMGISYTGVLVIINPFSATSRVMMWKYLLPVISAFTGSLGVTMLRKINKRSNFYVCPFFFSIGQIVISPILIGSSEKVFTFTKTGILVILAITMAGFLGQITNSMAIKYEKAGRISMISYMSLVYSFACDIFIFHAKITANVVIGSLMILGSSICITVLKGKDVIQ